MARGKTSAPRLARPNWPWAMIGLLIGALAALWVQAPAHWLASGMQALTHGRLMLAEPAGTVWNGSAQLVLTGGAQSQDRAALDHRLQWRLRADAGPALEIRLAHPTALTRPLMLRLTAGWMQAHLELAPQAAEPPPELRLPASWLSALGTPWNTLQPSGHMALKAPRLKLQLSPERTAIEEALLILEMDQMGSRISTLPVLGHYVLQIQASSGDVGGLRLTLSSRPDSLLQLQGAGRWRPGERMEFRGEAHAAQGHDAALANLLNIIGRREGARSLISL